MNRKLLYRLFPYSRRQQHEDYTTRDTLLLLLLLFLATRTEIFTLRSDAYWISLMEACVFISTRLLPYVPQARNERPVSYWTIAFFGSILFKIYKRRRQYEKYTTSNVQKYAYWTLLIAARIQDRDN